MIRPTIFRKFLIASLLIALLPLLVASIFQFSGLEQVRDRLALEISNSAEQQAAEGLQMRARQVADNIADYLYRREDDLRFLSRFAADRQVLLSFWKQQRSEVWERRAVAANQVREVREQLPIYRSFALIDANGQEQMVLKDGRFLPPAELRNVALPAFTEFKSETYFQAIKSMQPGQIHVTHLTGFHVNKQQQLAGADEPEQALGSRYEGVIRFGMPLYGPDGRFNGAFVISMDHRHLMEFTQHIDPGPHFSTVFPSYKSGNYAFLFDDEGWIITHPKLWDIRGVDRQGRLVPPYTDRSSARSIEAGTIPFNLDYAGFIHPNYPKASALVRKQQSGVLELTNVGGARKIMAYAPILYNTGPYKRHGIFGGITIGYQVDQFQQQASAGSHLITSKLKEYRQKSALFISLAALVAALAAWLLARGITRPLQHLSEGARRLANGETGNRVVVKGSDELAELALAFNAMVAELEQRKANLVATLEQLQESRQAILDERNFKESILESISSAITTFAPDGTLTSRNSTVESFLGRSWPLGSHYATVFDGWEALPARIGRAFSEGSGYGREPLKVEQDGRIRHFDVGIFPIGEHAERGLTVTLRDETIREDLREETVRLERLASLGKLAAGISHEIRNPLTGISLLLDDLHDRAQLGDKDREMLTKAMAEIERMERLISALLTFAAPPRSRFAPGNPGEAAEDVVMLMQRACQRQGIVLNLERSPLPNCLIDAEKIRQALLNLLKNALEALPLGGTITMTINRDSHDALITVTDSGHGIPAQDLPLIFEPFFTRKGAGTGLGLSITRQIIEEHGGSISVDSAFGHGTSFRIRLPLLQVLPGAVSI
ncbi:HAMP domain-containing protein [Trichlorobacter lovleyi]|uniref:PAS domain-containing sensor histidine kinase n=1 Tax=Trichlorobacter lovleyi TaxID=313985 RepID=UPI00224034C2|nr:PAS domain-containing sensor histidine kinase [Trichlorobacter lovleyi]QOX78891.1 HAMP domain-containing protein [Trichlorobacter lovleyi]